MFVLQTGFSNIPLSALKYHAGSRWTVPLLAHADLQLDRPWNEELVSPSGIMVISCCAVPPSQLVNDKMVLCFTLFVMFPCAEVKHLSVTSARTSLIAIFLVRTECFRTIQTSYCRV